MTIESMLKDVQNKIASKEFIINMHAAEHKKYLDMSYSEPEYFTRRMRQEQADSEMKAMDRLNNEWMQLKAEEKRLLSLQR